MWRIWQSGRATLQEIETCWSLADIWTANHLLDLEADAQAEEYNRNLKD